MASYLITGTSKGLGLELARQLASLPVSEVSKIFAAARSHSPRLEKLAKNFPNRVVIINLDVTNEGSIKQAVAEVESNLGDMGLDVLINNAGICEYSPSGVHTMDNLASSFTTNVLGVHWVSKAFIPLLQKGTTKKIINISSTIGSITLSRNVHLFPAPSYKITKAALNSLTVQYALDYEKEGFTIFALAPGWLRTDQGGSGADLSVNQGARASLEKILGANKGENGKFLKIYIGWETGEWMNQYDGFDAPW